MMKATAPEITAPANQRHPNRQTEIRRTERDRIGADAEKTGMAKADLSGKAHQQVETDDGHGIDVDQGRNAEIKAARDNRRQQHDATANPPRNQ